MFRITSIIYIIYIIYIIFLNYAAGAGAATAGAAPGFLSNTKMPKPANNNKNIQEHELDPELFEDPPSDDDDDVELSKCSILFFSLFLNCSIILYILSIYFFISILYIFFIVFLVSFFVFYVLYQ